MSRLEDLIDKMCPHGVEFKPLGECIEQNLGGGTPSRSVANYWGGTIPWASVGDLSGGGNYISDTRDHITSAGLANSPSNMIKAGDVVVAVKISPGKMKIAGTDIAINQDLRGLTLRSFLDNRFLVYYSQTMGALGNGAIVRGITVEVLERIAIPVPPLAVQRAIVEVLDNFAKLEAELEAELEARRRQYVYYRDALLGFAEDGGQEVEWRALGEVGRFLRGRRFTKADYEENGIACMHYGEIYTHYGTVARAAQSHLRPSMAGVLRYASPGDVVIVDVGETVEDVGKAVAWLGDEDVAIHDHSYAFRHSMNPTFVAYCMQTKRFIREKAKYIARTKVNTLLVSGFAKIKIPVPPPEEQARIVSVLEKWDALVNDLSIGLPAELKARRKQYEHYRDRLLTFRVAA